MCRLEGLRLILPMWCVGWCDSLTVRRLLKVISVGELNLLRDRGLIILVWFGWTWISKSYM